MIIRLFIKVAFLLKITNFLGTATFTGWSRNGHSNSGYFSIESLAKN